MEKANRIRYGLSNVHVFPITAGTENDTKPTYEKAIKVSGGVSLSMSPKGELTKVFADNIVYYTANGNAGYEGDLEIIKIPKELELKLLGQKQDETTGLVTESANDQIGYFGLAFEFEGDVSKTKHILYKCTMERPDISGNTKEDKINPEKDKLKLSASPLGDTNGTIKAYCDDSSKQVYKDWFTKPVFAGAQEI